MINYYIQTSKAALLPVLFIANLCAHTPVSAADTPHPQSHGFLALSLGYYDVFDEPDGVDARIEYRPQTNIIIDELKPWLGIEATSQGSLWGGGGLLYNLDISDKLRLTPSLGLGLYTKGGSDIDLDSLLQFKTQIEASYKLKSESRIGLSLSHMSNGSLGNSNPGTEVISINYQIPLNQLYEK